MTTANKTDEKPESIPFYPDHVRTELYVTIGVFALVFAVGIIGQLWPVGVGEPADPLNTPLHAKPEWYFLFLYQFLKYVPEVVGVMTPIIGLLILVIWPFLDRRKTDTYRARTIRIVGVVVFLIIATVLTILGEVS